MHSPPFFLYDDGLWFVPQSRQASPCLESLPRKPISGWLFLVAQTSPQMSRLQGAALTTRSKPDSPSFPNIPPLAIPQIVLVTVKFFYLLMHFVSVSRLSAP